MSGRVVICGLDTESLPKINASECEVLLKDYLQNGNDEAKERLITANIRLVLSIVQRYYDYKGSFDDLFQVGMLGLLKAINNFNLDLNVRFSTYAVPMIIGEVRKFVREGNSLKVGRATRDIAYRCMQVKERKSDGCYEPSLTEIAEELALPVVEVLSALDAISEPLSLYSSVYNDGEESVLLLDQISDTKNTDERLIMELTLVDALDILTEKERNVIKSRYYDGKTQVELASECGISQAQVSRLEKTALEKMREFFEI